MAKMRNGFVSNSSSSSFLIYGVCLEESEIFDKEVDDVLGEVDELFKDEKNIEIYRPFDDSIYIGSCLSSMNDNETKGEFKKKVEEKIKRVLKKDNLEFDTYSESWYGG